MARAYPSSSHKLLKEVCERLSWIILVGYDHLDAPVPKYFFCRGVWTVREDIGLWSDGCQRSLSLILCARHTMTHRSMYAKQEEAAGRVAGHPH
jgi:hypothetical protein